MPIETSFQNIMKIDLNKISRENFILREESLGNDNCFLTFPQHIGCKWTKDNLIFRSSIWNSNGEPVSLGFRKFFNWHEQPDLSYTPYSTTADGGVTTVSKEDGTCLIVSKYKGQLITRTRGTFCASGMNNGHELPYLMEKYPKCFSFDEETPNYSLIFEWTSPENIIVLRTTEPDINLIGKIFHEDYSMETQKNLDILGQELEVNRPETFKFDKIQDILDSVTSWEGREGVCVYSKGDQEIRKIKSDWYLSLHRMKSELGNYEKVIDVFLKSNRPNYTDFYKLIVDTLDFEIAEQSRGHLSRVCDSYKEVKNIINGMESFVAGIKGLPSRKDQALKIESAYGKTNRASYVFSILDGKELDDKQIKKLLFQV